MIGRDGLHLGGEPGSAQARKLVGMNLERHTRRLPRLKDAARLFHAKGAFLAEYIDKGWLKATLPDKLGNGGDHLLNDQADVIVAAILELRRHSMGAQECRHNADRMFSAEAVNRLKL